MSAVLAERCTSVTGICHHTFIITIQTNIPNTGQTQSHGRSRHTCHRKHLWTSTWTFSPSWWLKTSNCAAAAERPAWLSFAWAAACAIVAVWLLTQRRRLCSWTQALYLHSADSSVLKSARRVVRTALEMETLAISFECGQIFGSEESVLRHRSLICPLRPRRR